MRNRYLNWSYLFLFVTLLCSGALQAQWLPNNAQQNQTIYRGASVGVNTGSTVPNMLSVKNASTMDGVSIDGTNPALTLRNSSPLGYFGAVTAAGAFFTGTAINDIALRSEGGKIHFGVGTGAPTMTIEGSNVGIGATHPTSQLYVYKQSTSVTTGGEATFETDMQLNPSSAQGANTFRAAVDGYAYLNNTNGVTTNNGVSSMAGVEGDAENYLPGTIGTMSGVSGWAYNDHASGNVNRLIGVNSAAESDAGNVTYMDGFFTWLGVYGGTVQNLYGVQVSSNITGGAITNDYGLYSAPWGNATNKYGLFLPNVTGTATNDYGIYQDGAGHKNYFAGNVGVGATAPTRALQVGTSGTWNDSSGILVKGSNPGIEFADTEATPQRWLIGNGVNAANDGKLSLAHDFNTGQPRIVVLPSSGYVGINTTSPTAPLTVNGEILALGGVRFPDGILQTHASTAGGSAADVSAGAFGANTGGGNYSFPAGLAIGTTTQTGALSVVGGANGFAQFQRSGKLMYVNANYNDANAYGFLGMRNSDAMGLSVSSSDLHPEYMFISTTGRIGIGTPTPASRFQVLSYGGGEQVGMSLSAGTGFNTSVAGDAVTIAMDTYNSGAYPLKLKAIQTQSAPDYPNDAFAISTNTNGTEVERVRVANNGNVGIGTSNPAYALDVNGTIHATNVIGASYQDVAEWVPASTEMTAGTVVVLSPEKNNEVMPSGSAYDSTVAGVVSAKPGIILGEPSAEKAQVATTGRVRVKVDATKEPIKIGDLLVTSDKPGTAMKSIPVNVSGIAMHRPGTIIGKALEPLASGTGEVLVLLSLQ